VPSIPSLDSLAHAAPLAPTVVTVPVPDEPVSSQGSPDAAIESKATAKQPTRKRFMTLEA
jgi:hypothetical protein